MIIVKAVIADIKEYQRGVLPQNARRIDTPSSIDEMMKKTTPITALLCAIPIVMMFGMACMGMVSPAPDVYNVFSILKYSNKKDKVMFYEDDLFIISE